MADNKRPVPVEHIERSILLIRGHRVMLDSHLAELYGVETRMLLQAVSRNEKRFPEDFMFQLSEREYGDLRSQIVISKKGRGGRRYRPKEGVQLLSGLCGDTIIPSSKIIALARGIIKRSKLKPRDAVHLACAEIGVCDYFVTCDDTLISIFQRSRPGAKLKVKAINPVEFIRNEGANYGQS